jgi:hypothetical protein
MASIFTLDSIDDFSEKLNIDELYESKRQHDLNNLALFNKILNRIHVRIRTTSKQTKHEQFCWFLVPEIILGVPKYDQGACIAYLIDKLKVNGFNVRYIHPNTLFISWNHFVPSYVRTELKNKTGIVIDEYGNKVVTDEDNEDKPANEQIGPDGLILKNTNNDQKSKQQKKEYTPIKSYRPSGNLVYDEDLLNKLEGKFS